MWTSCQRLGYIDVLRPFRVLVSMSGKRGRPGFVRVRQCLVPPPTPAASQSCPLITHGDSANTDLDWQSFPSITHWVASPASDWLSSQKSHLRGRPMEHQGFKRGWPWGGHLTGPYLLLAFTWEPRSWWLFYVCFSVPFLSFSLFSFSLHATFLSNLRSHRFISF